MTLLAFVFVLGVLVFVHELGHFLAAKRVGIRVLKFQLGFNPTILSFRRGDTEYGIGALPLGGYVKMAVERPEDVERDEHGPVIVRTDEFLSKTKWQRFQVLLIGPAMNPLLAVLLTALVLFRRKFFLKPLLEAIGDLPFAISPVVVGISLILVYGRTGWFGPWLQDHGIQIIFSLPGMVLATIFVSLPFVVREVVPVLREIGTDQEQAASTLGASGLQPFRRLTLPAIPLAVTYGVVLTTPRAPAESAAVPVVQ